MPEKDEKICVITEVGDLGIGVSELPSEDQKAYKEAKKDKDKE